LIQLVQVAVGGNGRRVLSPEPSFVMYRLIAAVTGSQYVGVALNDDFSLDLDAMVQAIRRHDPALVFIAYPNNPTANLFDRETIDTLIACSPGLVVIDEAYHPFAKQSFMDHPATRDNLLVMRTVSKLGLAGLRLGMLVGARAWVEEFEKIRLPYNINSLTQISADFALSRHAVFADQAARICSERDRVSVRLGNHKDLTVYPSDTNFLLFRCLEVDADQVFAGLVDRGVLVKNLNRSAASLSGCLRVTVGTPEENDIFLNALEAVLNPHSG
ncbi:MAG: aminotransferase class I/II-fold pyridoxal phosphate-dependent enzyme, partial [Gammaproteobacteria bacterium]|nr:aminotransferase class I/II-fold pyridoxal phosphate-dependent enzyme [Gammaproteobacteria bacterium]